MVNAQPFLLMMLTKVGCVGEPVETIAAAPPFLMPALLNRRYRWCSQHDMTVCVPSSFLTYVRVYHRGRKYLGWWKRLG